MAIMASWLKAIRAVREQQKRVAEYERATNVSISNSELERVLEHCQKHADRSRALVILKLRSGDVVELHPRSVASQTRMVERLRSESYDIADILADAGKQLEGR